MQRTRSPMKQIRRCFCHAFAFGLAATGSAPGHWSALAPTWLLHSMGSHASLRPGESWLQPKRPYGPVLMAGQLAAEHVVEGYEADCCIHRSQLRCNRTKLRSHLLLDRFAGWICSGEGSLHISCTTWLHPAEVYVGDLNFSFRSGCPCR